MSLQTFFLDKQDISSERSEEFTLDLCKQDLHHMHVLRLEIGEHINIVDGNKNYFECEITNLSKDEVQVRICTHETSKLHNTKLSLPNITLFQGLPKSDAMESIIRQGTELGLNSIVPVVTARSVSRPDNTRASKKVQRWAAIAKSASMQSGRRDITEVLIPQTFAAALSMLSSFNCVILFWEESDVCASFEDTLDKINSSADNIAIFVGPEGGFSTDEVNAICEAAQNVCVCSLGDTILRVDTAAVSAIALLRHFFRLKFRESH